MSQSDCLNKAFSQSDLNSHLFILFSLQVFVHLRGTKGKVSKEQLVNELEDLEEEQENETQTSFKRASSQKCFISGIDIGELIALEIEVCLLQFIYGGGD